MSVAPLSAAGDLPRSMRIASLLASATEAVYALGLGDDLVAISHECDYPPEVLDRPRISRARFDVDGLDSGEIDRAVRSAMTKHGSVFTVDIDLARELAPELILTQAVCDVCAVPADLAQQVANALEPTPQVVSLDAHAIGDILQGIEDVGRAAGVPARAERYVAGLKTRLERVRSGTADATPSRVLAIEWLDPPFVPGHWTPEMVDLAGGELVEGAAGKPSYETAWAALERHDPDVLLVMPCGYGLAATRAEADRFTTELLRIAPRAIAAGRGFVVDGSAYFNRSGPRTVDGVELLGALLHPECFPDYAIDAKATVWQPNTAEQN